MIFLQHWPQEIRAQETLALKPKSSKHGQGGLLHCCSIYVLRLLENPRRVRMRIFAPDSKQGSKR